MTLAQDPAAAAADASMASSPLRPRRRRHQYDAAARDDYQQEEKKHEQHDPLPPVPQCNPAADGRHINEKHVDGVKNDGGGDLPEITSASSSSSSSSSSSLPLLALCATGISSCYLLYGTLQERLLSPSSHHGEDDVGPIATFLLATGTASCVLTSLALIQLERRWKRNAKNTKKTFEGRHDGGERKLDQTLLLYTSLSYCLAMTASNEALHHVSYPTAVLAKSSKLIPTMIAGVFVEKRRYQTAEWIGALLITAGVVLFNWSRMVAARSKDGVQANDDDEDSWFGLALLGISLTMDGLLSSCQGTLQRGRRANFRCPSALEGMLYTNLYATFFLIPLSVYTGQFANGMKLMTSGPDPTSSVQAVVSLNLAASIGQVFVFLTIHHFGSLVCTTITTTRKFLTILLSVYKFGHVFDVTQWCCVAMVFGGLYWSIVARVVLVGGGGGGGVENATPTSRKDRKVD